MYGVTACNGSMSTRKPTGIAWNPRSAGVTGLVRLQGPDERKQHL